MESIDENKMKLCSAFMKKSEFSTMQYLNAAVARSATGPFFVPEFSSPSDAAT